MVELSCCFLQFPLSKDRLEWARFMVNIVLIASLVKRCSNKAFVPTTGESVGESHAGSHVGRHVACLSIPELGRV